MDRLTGRSDTTTTTNNNNHKRPVYTFPQQQVAAGAGQPLRRRRGRRRRRNAGPPFGFILCLIIVNGGLLYLLIQLWYLGLGKVFWNKRVKSSSVPPFPGHYSRPNNHNNNNPNNNHNHNNNNNNHSPILVVGLPKAGTSSLFEFFHCFGYYSQHWYCCRKQTSAQKGGPTYMSECMLYNLRFGLPILQGCGEYDVYTELNGPRPRPVVSNQNQNLQNQQNQQQPRIFLPQHYHLQELHDYAPDATWILNIRNVEDWIDSVMAVDGHMLLRQLIYEVQQHDPFETPRGRKEGREFLRRFWDQHVAKIYTFVQQQQSSHNLITVNISNPNAGVQLARSLGWLGEGEKEKEEEDQERRAARCWGQHNKREEDGHV